MSAPAEFLPEFARDRAERVFELPFGFATHSPRRFPHAHDHNMIWVRRPVGAAELLAAADEQFADLPFRRVDVPSEGVTDVLAAAFADAGYTREDDVVMTWRRAPDPDRPDASGVVELTLAQRIEVAERVWGETDDAMPAAVRRELAERARSALNAARCTFLGVVGADATVQASCDLFVRGGLARVEEVATLTAFRGRGHASRLVRAATERALVADPSRTVFLLADADDWPRRLYARLGFRVTGGHTVWSRVSGP